jgi:hypothetical protein
MMGPEPLEQPPKRQGEAGPGRIPDARTEIASVRYTIVAIDVFS